MGTFLLSHYKLSQYLTLLSKITFEDFLPYSFVKDNSKKTSRKLNQDLANSGNDLFGISIRQYILKQFAGGLKNFHFSQKTCYDRTNWKIYKPLYRFWL